MKHMIFHGIPVMNTVTEEQQEILRNRDSQIGLPSTLSPTEISELPQRPVLQAPGPVDPSAIELLTPSPILPKDQNQDLGSICGGCEAIVSSAEQISIAALIMCVGTFEGSLFYCAEERRINN